MKIVVIGGSGLIGKKLIPLLRGHEAVSASPSSGVNTLTGEGLSGALAGAAVVVDVTNSPSFEDKAVLEFFEKSTRNILAAEAAAGVKHHVALSVVGADRFPDSGYLRAKVAQESLIKASGVPYTILRATHFFEFLSPIAGSGADTVRLPSAPMQPLAADDVAAALADVAVGSPANGVLEVAGRSPYRSPRSWARPWPRAGTNGRWSPTHRPATTARRWMISASSQETPTRALARPGSRSGPVAARLGSEPGGEIATGGD